MRFFIINILAPILVAIIGGVSLFHYGDYFSKDHHLRYSTSQFVVPFVDDSNYIFDYIRVENQTPDALQNVTLLVKSQADLFGTEISFSKDELNRLGPSTNITKNEIRITVPKLRSSDYFNLQISQKTDEIVSRDFDLFSDTIIGSEFTDNEISFFSKYSTIFFTFIIYLSCIFIIIRTRTTLFNAVNDTAFCLLHGGNLEKASLLLDRKLVNSGGGVYEITNYACCLIESQNYEEAKRLIHSAEIMEGNGKHSNILLAKALLAHRQGESDAAKDYYRKFKKKRWLANLIVSYSSSSIITELDKEYLG